MPDDLAALRTDAVRLPAMYHSAELMVSRGVGGGVQVMTHKRDEAAAVSLTLDDTVRLIRLANATLPDDNPRKITRADVHALETFDPNREPGQNEVGRVHWSWQQIHRLRAKLAALLPPEMANA